jgi:hypothetical protein
LKFFNCKKNLFIKIRSRFFINKIISIEADSQIKTKNIF